MSEEVLKNYNLRIEESDYEALEEIANSEIGGSVNTEIRKAIKEYIRLKRQNKKSKTNKS